MAREETASPPADGTHAAREIRERRERTLAEEALGLHGLKASRLGLLGHRLERFGIRKYKTVFRLRSVVRQDFTLHIYRDVDASGSPEDLRSNAGRGTAHALRSQVQWMRALREGGVVVPEPVPTADGSPFGVVADGRKRKRRCILMAWTPGRPLGDGPVERVRPHGLRSAGAYLARMHRVSERFRSRRAS